MRASLLISVCDEFTGAFLDNEVRVRVFPTRGGLIDLHLTHHEAAELAMRLLTVLGTVEANKPSLQGEAV